ncbi:hypothetical protein QJV03_03070 [Listeria swaminathanii]|uniref:DUF5082 domain-containing protein n=1 Tax=Listeria swaminathanii TaxID=2713501 RepID=A0ABU2IDT4_9LIST|nr:MULTISPECIES: hypothetical protein [Listeria]MBC2121669.1 hypothetical protein [Listeria marthii]MDT0016168.1 hypothetical protein [Listeria swaminathanii]MDT0021604.1 hypothetical protein [Listeria swaminathanii]MDT0032568.1 hypothetical protein [Listeria swaminathanii]MDT0051582.1 hypothetical protein [Listeria swaminathanii]
MTNKLNQINNTLQDLEIELNKTKRQTENLKEVDTIGYITRNQCDNLFADIAHFWKGDNATQFLNISHEEVSFKINKLQKETYQRIEELAVKERKIKTNIYTTEELYYQEKKQQLEEDN